MKLFSNSNPNALDNAYDFVEQLMDKDSLNSPLDLVGSDNFIPLNVYDLLTHEKIVLTKDALAKVESRLN